MALIDNPHVPRHARRISEAPGHHRASPDPRVRWRQVRVVEYGGPASVRVTTFTDSAVPAHVVGGRAGAAEVFAVLAAEICAAFDELAGVLR